MSDEQDRLVVRIPISPAEEKNISKLLGNLIVQHQNEFLPFLSRFIQVDSRYTYLEESLEISDLHLEDDHGEASITFTSNFYAGCRDQNGIEEHDAILPFTLQDGSMVFDLELPKRWNLDN